LSADGKAQASMGADAADYDGDGRLDVFVTNFTNQSNSLFRNEGSGTFQEIAARLNLAAVSIPMSGFGTRFADYDNDGDADLLVANGHPFEPVARVWPGISWAEPAFVFEKVGMSFREVAKDRGDVLRTNCSGRGLATGDYDNDGDVDVLLLCVGQPPRLLRNDGGNRRSWLGVRLIGTTSNRDGIGARLEALVDGKTMIRVIAGGTSYSSVSDRRQLFGLGDSARVERLQVRWPSGKIDVMSNVPARQYVTILEGHSSDPAPSAHRTSPKKVERLSTNHSLEAGDLP
jgi:hypothetical protein